MAATLAYRPGDRAHAALRGYKDAADHRVRSHFADRLTATFDWFLAAHHGCLAARTGPFDAVCPVPATRQRPGGRRGGVDGHPLDAVLARAVDTRGLARVQLRRGPGPVGHLVASPEAFLAPDRQLVGRRVLVVDDTWTTGAHARSAAAALRAAGASVAGILVIGRCVDPAASAAGADWWRQATAASLRARHRGLAARWASRATCPPAGCSLPRCPAGDPSTAAVRR